MSIDWKPIETAPKSWEPILVWAITEQELEDAEDEGRTPVFSAMVAEHSPLQPGVWWLSAALNNVHCPMYWAEITPPECASPVKGGAA